MLTQVRLLLSIRAIRTFLILMPVIVIYWQDFGLSVTQIFILQVAYSIVIVLFEVPSGFITDHIGRKRAIIIGLIITLLAWTLLYLAPSFVGFMIAWMCGALGSSFLSGSDSALLYDTLQEHDAKEDYKKYEGRMLSLTTFSEAIAALCATAILLFFVIKDVLLVQIISAALALPLAFFLKEPTYHKEKEKLNFKYIAQVVFSRPRLRNLIALSGMIGAATLVMVWLAQPYWREIGIEVKYFGVLWAALNFIVSLGALIAHRMEAYFSFKTLFGMFAAAPLVLFGLLTLEWFWLSVCVIPLFWLLRGIKTPIVFDYINKEVDSTIRATVLSMNQLSLRLFFSIFSPFIGWVADLWSFEMAFATSAILLGSVTLVFYGLLMMALAKDGRTS